MAEPTAPAQAEFTFSGEKILAMQRRTAVRYRCALATPGWLTLPDGGTLETWIHNLSETGIGLNAGQRLEPGTALVIRLRGPAPGGEVALGARVVHTTAEADGSWRVGCAFTHRLKAESLAALLGVPALPPEGSDGRGDVP
jgi:hypothetical protein